MYSYASTSIIPARTEVYLVNFDPVVGHEQGHIRPAIVVSATTFNQLPHGLAFVVPTTRTRRDLPFHITIDPPEGGLRNTSYAMCEQEKSLSTRRFGRRLGVVTPETMLAIESVLKDILGFRPS